MYLGNGCNLDAVTLDHLRIFIAAADEGSISAAGRLGRRAGSVVSQVIAALEGQLGVPLFDRGSRYPRLTNQGCAHRGKGPWSAGWTLSRPARKASQAALRESCRWQST